MAATLALPATGTPEIARALGTAARLPVVWLAFQDCTGDTESFLHRGQPNRQQHSAGFDLAQLPRDPHGAERQDGRKSLKDTLAMYPGQYVAVIEGAVSTAANGFYCAIGGRPATSIIREVCGSAMKTIALGACAWEGGWSAATPNPTRRHRRQDHGAGHQQPHQHARLSHERREPGSRLRPVFDVRYMARDEWRRSPQVRLRQGNPRGVRAEEALFRRPVRAGVGRSGPPQRLVSFARWAAGAQRRSTTAPR